MFNLYPFFTISFTVLLTFRIYNVLIKYKEAAVWNMY